MKSGKLFVLCALLVLLMLTSVGCVPGDGANSETKAAGFFMGIWHGWIAPISLIVSIFNKDIGIYEVYNNGFWYDLGYYMAIVSGFGGLALSRRKRTCTDNIRRDT
ncbi:MAG TPA: hypothetical protein VN512_00415 [Clostridia bacterium]|nr:hypothetical protein [Clostridia bacterium]